MHTRRETKNPYDHYNQPRNKKGAKTFHHTMEESKLQLFNDFLGCMATVCLFLPLGSRENNIPLLLTASDRMVDVIQINFKDEPPILKLATHCIEEPLTDAKIVSVSHSSAIVIASGMYGSLYSFQVQLIRDTDKDDMSDEIEFGRLNVSIRETGHLKLHSDVCTCVDICVKNNEEFVLITGGEDARVNILHIKGDLNLNNNNNNNNISITTIPAESTGFFPIQSIRFESKFGTNFFTLSIDGTIKRWNTDAPKRANYSTKDEAAIAFDQIAYTTLDVHPAQPLRIITGDSFGTLSVWNLEKKGIVGNPSLRLQPSEQYPLTTLGALGYNGCLWKVQFDNTSPDNVITCSNIGQLVIYYLSSNGETIKRFIVPVFAPILSFTQLDNHLAFITDEGRLYYSANLIGTKKSYE